MVADDPDQSTLFEMVLKRAGYEIDAVPDGHSALERLVTAHYDLLLTDFMLPDIDGNVIIRTVQQRRSPIRTVLMSNHVDVCSLASACNADGFYRKDDNNRLLAVIAALLPP